MQDAIARSAKSAGRRRGFAVLAGAALLLGACESIPEAVNPLTWFEDDEPAPAAAPATVKTGTADKPYPALGTVPKRPPTLESQQAGIAQGLAADNQNARYTDEKIPREIARRTAVPRAGSATSSVPAPRPVPPAPRVAAPQPQPAVPRPVPRRNSALPPPTAVAPPVQTATRPAPAIAPRPAAPPVAAPRPVPAPAAPQPSAATGPIKVATIYFNDGSTALQGPDQSILRQVAAAQRRTGQTVRVVGHASGRVRTFDASRRHMINYQVSLDRAHAVAAALLNMGVPVGKLLVEGKGDTAPLYAEYSPTGEAANRRAELYFVN